MNAFAVAVLCLVGRSANGLQPSMDYAVKVNGEDTFVYLATVPGPTGSNPMRTNVSFIQVVLPSPSTSSGARVANVEVFVTGNSSVGTAALRPRGSPAVTVQGLSTVKFGLKEPGTHILELNGEWEVNSLSTGLMIFVTEADPSPPSPADSSVIYFGAGVHTVAGDNGTLTLANDSTVYLAHGAVVLGHIVGMFECVQYYSIRDRREEPWNVSFALLRAAIRLLTCVVTWARNDVALGLHLYIYIFIYILMLSH